MTDAETDEDVGLELELLSRLIRCKSVTPDDAGCQDILTGLLENLGFKCEPMPFGEEIWVIDTNTRRRLHRIELEVPVNSLLVTQEAEPKLIVADV